MLNLLTLTTETYVNPIIFKYPWMIPCFFLSFIFAIIAGKHQSESKKRLFFSLGAASIIIFCSPIVLEVIPKDLLTTNFFDHYLFLRVGIISAIVLPIIGLIITVLRKDFREAVPEKKSKAILSNVIMGTCMSVFIGCGVWRIQLQDFVFGGIFVLFPLYAFFSLTTKASLPETEKEEKERFFDNLQVQYEIAYVYELTSVTGVYYDKQTNYIIIKINSKDEFDKLLKTSWNKEELAKSSFSMSNIKGALFKEMFSSMLLQNLKATLEHQGLRIELEE